ncbi:hypothetical protein WJX72_008573 [[Myrmecia] bisecta]|uniref:FAD-binding domain-containing protein n=1 Tax=[Myrmecia] bisecta TaxID=41462 RepID=A0AAW1QGA6_9CHLO
MSDRKTAVIVGAGPAGLNTAILLANRGFQVQVYDKRNLDPAAAANKRTYIISINPRGAKAMTEAGVRIPQQGHPIEGLASGSRIEFQRVTGKIGGRQLPPMQFFCERRSLVEHMVGEAKRLHPTAITCHFNQGLQAVDFQRKEATFASASGQTNSVQYDLLVAADGVNSVTRTQLQKAVPHLQVEKYDNVRSLKVFSGLKKPANLVLSDERGSYLRFIVGKRVPTAMLIWTAPDGTISGALYSLTTIMQQISTAQEYDAFIRENLPQFPTGMVPEVAAQLEECPLTVGSASVRCSQLHGPATVLIGDAGHGVTPAMGQGAVSALESTVVFAQVLDECNGNIQRAVELFTQRRLPEVHALFEMDRTANPRQGGDGKLNLHFLGNTFHLVKGMLLQKVAPGIFQGPGLMRMAEGEASFAQVNAALKRDTAIAGGLSSIGVAVAIASTAVMAGHLLRYVGLTA